LRALVDALRRADILIGSGGKRVLDCEVEAARGVRRSVHAARDLSAGSVLGADDTICLRPQGGVTPDGEASLAGRSTRTAIAAGAVITEDMLA
ncbi:MAG: SAF domain-containing protein, partial [Alphaproteobacteria bacterium]